MADVKTVPPLTRASVIEAHELIRSHIHYTPVLTNRTLTNLASSPRPAEDLAGTRWQGREPARPVLRLWFKCENLQRIGAFKVRGAFHAIKRLQAEPGWLDGGGDGGGSGSSGGEGGGGGGRERGVATHSSGNHAQALALAAAEHGIRAHIVMPEASVPQKVAATRGYGARVIFSGSTSVEREAVAARVVAETGARLVPPYDHPDIILGQGTMGLEMQEQVREMMGDGTDVKKKKKCSFQSSSSSLPLLSPLSQHQHQHQHQHQQQQLPPETGAGAGAGADGTARQRDKGLDAIIAPCGGGGMLSGIALSCEGTGIRVFGAEPSFEGADDGRRGYYSSSGTRVETVSSLTVADGLRTPIGVYPWSVIHGRRLVAGMYSVTEEEIKAAMRLVLERFKMVVEPSGCVGLAVALYDEDFRAMVEREAGGKGWDLGVVFSGGNVGLDAIGKLFADDSK